METETLAEIVGRALSPDFGMGWDLFLAAVPLFLAFVLFRGNTRGPLWWAGLVAFVLFLPNAAYPMTDILHFVLKVRQRPYLPSWAVGVLVVPEYFFYIGLSLLAYVFSLQFFGIYLRRLGKPQLVVPMELSLHVLSALGIYLGRARRLNSWDALTHPGTVVEAGAGAFDRPKAALFIAGTAIVIAIAYSATAFVVDAIRKRRPSDPSRDELLNLLHQIGFEVGRDSAGRLFIRRQGLDWPPAARRNDASPAWQGGEPPTR